MRRISLLVLGVLGVTALAVVAVEYLYVPTVVIVNRSGHDVTNVRYEFLAGTGDAAEHTIDRIASGDSHRLTARTSDLIVGPVEYEFQGRRVVWRNAANVTPAETYTLTIGEDGRIDGSYSMLD